MSTNKKIYIGLQFVWLALCGYSLISFLTHDSAWVNPEISQLLFLKITALTFPIGIIFVTIFGFLFEVLENVGLDLTAVIPDKVETILVWLFMTILGYVQWFVFVPKLYVWVRSKIPSKSHSI